MSFGVVETICDVAAPQQLITPSSCDVHRRRQASPTCLESVIARLQSTPTMIPDAPTLNSRVHPRSVTAQTASRVARSVTSPPLPAGCVVGFPGLAHQRRAKGDVINQPPLLATIGGPVHQSA